MGVALEGIRILDLTDSIIGPYATTVLASCGAEIIKIESRYHLGFRGTGARDPRAGGRSVVPQAPEKEIDFSQVNLDLVLSPMFAQYGHDKLSITLNMTRPEARDLFKKLVKISDVIVDNLRSGTMERWGLNYASLQRIKDDIIVASLQSMGKGPYEGWTTWGMNLLSFSGFSSEWGHPGTPMTERAASGYLVDYIGAGQASAAILAAIFHRAMTGEGQYIELSQAEAGASVLGVSYLDYFVNKRIPSPRGNRQPQFAPYNCYRCRGDDNWCVIAIFTEEEWANFCQALDNPSWTAEVKFKDVSSRLQNVAELDSNIETWTRAYTPHQVMRILQSFGVPAGAVQNSEDLYYDAQLRTRGYMIEQNIPFLGSTTLGGVPLRLSAGQVKNPGQAPKLGEHNNYVFGQLLGLGQKEIDDLVKADVIV
jgi:crotonobetainyl-CoA:carnitine CoA-transferase CaiB-like acyl-CoA transferase